MLTLVSWLKKNGRSCSSEYDSTHVYWCVCERADPFGLTAQQYAS